VLGVYQKLPGWRRGGNDDPADYFARYGAATILIGRFFTSVRVFAWPVAAARGVGYGQFVTLDVVAAALWASLWVGLGAAVGTGWVTVAERASVWTLVAWVLILIPFLGGVAMYVRQRARRGSASRTRERAGDAPVVTSRRTRGRSVCG
jgi:membrane protein DedA with SNARE-associated domain